MSEPNPPNEILIIPPTGMAAVGSPFAGPESRIEGEVVHRYGQRVEIRRSYVEAMGGVALPISVAT